MADYGKYICKSALIKRGWTNKLIKTLLPAPIKRPNPHYKNTAPMLLWNLETVIALESTPALIEAMSKKKERSARAKAASETKKKNLCESALQYGFVVQQIPLQQLREDTLKAKEEWYASQSWHNPDYDYYSVYGADEDTIRRWEVNHIRHHLTSYDMACSSLDGRTGKNEAHYILKGKVLDRIAEVYPHLAEECERQKEERFLPSTADIAYCENLVNALPSHP